MEESAADDEERRETEEDEQKDVEMGNLVKERIAFMEAEEKKENRRRKRKVGLYRKRVRTKTWRGGRRQ